MSVKSLLMLGVGYVLGARAGRERYGQIQVLAKKAADRLEAKTREQSSGEHSQ